ncbi:hypothetical protein VTL71DRAFT_3640 [Oculimacula yallundae]|uniref:Uncharacterized protein n=1 Tax=Oculimacula yallundae TaxID=86028 RepID=A0ABR4C7R0_9HELO
MTSVVPSLTIYSYNDKESI